MRLPPALIVLSGLMLAYPGGAQEAQQQSILGTAPGVAIAAAPILTWSSPLPDAINMHIVRAPEGLVLFDALRRSDQVDEALAFVRSLDEPVKAIIITHAHTDHFGGVPFWRQHFPGIPIYASEGIKAEIRDDVVPDNARRRAMFGSRFPTQEMLDANLPDRIVEDGKPFTVAGLMVTPLVMGASESAAAVVYQLPDLDAAIVGDLVNVLTISAPTLSLDAWLGQLDRIEENTNERTTVFVGHGPSGPAKPLVADQRAYLLQLRELVAAAAANGEGVTTEETEAIVRTMRAAYPHHRGAAALPPEALIRESVGWVAEQLANPR